MTANAVFIDKDGTLLIDVPYNVDPERIMLTSGAADAVASFANCGYRVIVVSNQPGAALGLFPEQALAAVGERLRTLLPEVAGFYYCPHAPDHGCACRKPEPGLLERASREHGIDLPGSWMIGDILDDVEAGRRAGCRTILLDAGNETEWRMSETRSPHHIAASLAEAARIVSGGR